MTAFFFGPAAAAALSPKPKPSTPPSAADAMYSHRMWTHTAASRYRGTSELHPPAEVDISSPHVSPPRWSPQGQHHLVTVSEDIVTTPLQAQIERNRSLYSAGRRSGSRTPPILEARVSRRDPASTDSYLATLQATLAGIQMQRFSRYCPVLVIVPRPDYIYPNPQYD